MPAAWAAGIAAVGGIASAAIGSSAASDAASAQQQAADQASQTQLQMYNQTRKDLSPYLSTGTSALNQLSSLFGIGGSGPTNATAGRTLSALQNYPGYQFQFGQGLQALDRSAASRGLLLSGAQLKDAQTYGQGVAQSTALQPYLSTLTGLAGLGENAGSLTGNAATAAGQGIASSQLAGGQAQAAGIVGSSNAITGGLQSGLNNAILGYSLSNGLPDVSNEQFGGSPLTVQQTQGYDPSQYPVSTLSDVRAKTDIERVGKTDSGLSVYTYRYKTGGPRQMGVMAQEVERVRPDAVTTLRSGLKMVNYSKLSPLTDYRMAA